MQKSFAKIFLLFFLCFVLLCPLLGAAQGDNLLSNGDFETLTAAELPRDWQYSYWKKDGSTFSVYGEGQDGGNCIGIVNETDNDARFEQTIPVKPNTYYHISAYVYSEQCSYTGVAAVLSVADSFAISNMVRNPPTWTKAEIYGKTTENQTSLTVQCRLGWYGMESSGVAYFDLVSVEELPQAPTGVILQPFDYSSSDYYDTMIASHVIAPESSSQTQAEEEVRNTYSKWVVVGVLALAVLLLFGHYLKKEGEENAAKMDRIFAIGLSLAFLTRLGIALFVDGYEVDYNCFMGWASRMAEVGPAEFYLEGFCDYPPLYMLFLGINGLLANLFGLSGKAFILLNKLFPMACDLVLSWFLYRIGKKVTQANMAAFMALCYAFLPAVLINSAAWGQVDSVLVLLSVLCLYCLAQEKMALSTVFFALGIMTKPQMLMFGPIFLAGFILHIIHDVKRGFKNLGLCFLLGLGIVLAIYLPCTIKQNPLWILDKYASTLSSYPYATVNALNLFGICGANWVDQNAAFLGKTYVFWGTVGMAVSIAFALALLVKKREGRLLPLCAAVMLLGIFFFGVRMHERYYMPSIGLLFLAAILNRDKRLFYAAGLIALPQFINVYMVLHGEHLPANHQGLQIATGLFLLLSMGYLFYVALDICLGKKEGSLLPAPFKPTRRLITTLHFPSMFERGDLQKAKMSRLDVLLMSGITLVYAVLALCNLGDTKAAQTVYHGAFGESLVFDTGESRILDSLWYYGEIGSGQYIVRVSEDGENWSEGATYTYEENTMFTWHIEKISMLGRYVQFTFREEFPLIELAVKGEDGQLLPLTLVKEEGTDPQAENLIDEQALVPQDFSYKNSMYFDEIYHARTGYEQANGLPWYETTHPPLGKVFMSWCIQLLGMTPFAWRLAGTLAGIAMVPALYYFLKLLFRKTELCAAGAILLCADGMHFAQTRMATIDSFVTLFILCSYLFMLRYILLSFYHEKFIKTLVPLFFSGLFMGLGVASKWTGIYGGLGLAILFFFTMGVRTAEYIKAKNSLSVLPDEPILAKIVKGYPKKMTLTLLSCVLFFVLIPALIYVGSYYQRIETGSTLKDIWKYQLDMLSYHKATLSSHPYESPWWTWPMMIKPLWAYWWQTAPEGWTGSINTMGNPYVWWGGFACILFMLVRIVRLDGQRDPRLLLLVFAYLAQLVPWILVPRSTYIYHYFTCVPFLVAALVYGYEQILARKHGKIWVWGSVCLAVLLFAFFYPAVSGMPIPDWYGRLMRWLPSWALFWGI